MRKRVRYSLSLIGNADKTPLTLDLPAETTVNPKGVSTVSIKTTGIETNKCTVMLACTAHGGKLPSYVVCSSEKQCRNLSFLGNVHPVGWFDDCITKDLIKKM